MGGGFQAAERTRSNACQLGGWVAAVIGSGGWALGVGRLGSILGPAAGGVLLGLGWTTHGLLLTAVVPGLIASAAVLALHYLEVSRPLRAGDGHPSRL